MADIRYIKFSASFEYVKEGRALYFDNLQTYVNEQYDSALNGLSGLYMGDSISEAIGYKGWAGELYEHYGVKSYNVSVSGSTLASNGIPNQLTKVPAEKTFDFVMLNGGVNDVWRSIALGSVSAEGTTQFDTETAIGALENLFSTLQTTYPDAEICYILNYACVGGDYPTDTFINDFAPLARAACEKWGVHCLDLVADEAFLAEFDATAAVHTYDGIHANIEGYKVITKDDEYTCDKCIISVGRSGSKWMEKICKELDIPTQSNRVDIGVRVELPAAVFAHLTDELYESKIVYRTEKYGDRVRTFCMNPKGAVVNENTNGIYYNRDTN